MSPNNLVPKPIYSQLSHNSSSDIVLALGELLRYSFKFKCLVASSQMSSELGSGTWFWNPAMRAWSGHQWCLPAQLFHPSFGNGLWIFFAEPLPPALGTCAVLRLAHHCSRISLNRNWSRDVRMAKLGVILRLLLVKKSWIPLWDSRSWELCRLGIAWGLWLTTMQTACAWESNHYQKKKGKKEKSQAKKQEYLMTLLDIWVHLYLKPIIHFLPSI